MNSSRRAAGTVLLLSAELLAANHSGRKSYVPEGDIHYSLAISSMTFNKEGTMLATTSGWIIGIWSVAKGTMVHDIRLQPSEGSIVTLSFSTDSKLLYGGSADGKLITWDVETGTEASSLATRPIAATPYPFFVTAAAFSHDDMLFVNGTHSGEVDVWETSTGKPIASLRGSHSQIRTLAFSRDDSLLAVGDSDALILIWNLKTRAEPVALRRPNPENPQTLGWVYKVLFSPDTNKLLSSGFHPGVLVWKISEAKVMSTIGANYDWVETMDLSSDGMHLLTGSKNGEDRDSITKVPRSHRVSLWHLGSGRRVAISTGTAAIFSPDGTLLAISDKQNITFVAPP